MSKSQDLQLRRGQRSEATVIGKVLLALQPFIPSGRSGGTGQGGILKAKELIDKKAWPYVQNDLRRRRRHPSRNSPADKLFATIDQLDHAAEIESTAEAENYYTTKSAIDNFIAKLG